MITKENFRDLMFANPVTLWTGMNPDLFKGMVIEKEVEGLLVQEVR